MTPPKFTLRDFSLRENIAYLNNSAIMNLNLFSKYLKNIKDNLTELRILANSLNTDLELLEEAINQNEVV